MSSLIHSWRRSDRWLPLPEILPLYCCVLGTGVAVGNSFVDVGVADSGNGGGPGVGAGGLLVGVGAVTWGVDWVAGSWVAAGALGVSPCWEHPHSAKPRTALATAICILRNDFIFVASFVDRHFSIIVLNAVQLRNSFVESTV